MFRNFQKILSWLAMFLVLVLMYHDMYREDKSRLLDVSNKSGGQNQFDDKQMENEARREVIAKLCSEIGQERKNKMDNSASLFYISKKNKIAFCPIPKVATSTMAFFFLRTEFEIDDLLPHGYDPNMTENEMQLSGIFPRPLLHKLIPGLEVNIQPKDLEKTWSSLTSLLVVRHPLDRLVSLYNNKFIGGVRDKAEAWIQCTKHIIGKYRVAFVDGPMDIVTPAESVRYRIQNILDDAKISGINRHWQPILRQCPVCSFNFSVYAKTENMEEDFSFFKKIANVDKEKQNIGKSNSGPKWVEAKEFWSQVDKEHVDMLAGPFVYKYDLEMFGYSIQEYFDSIGLSWK
eukprot:GFUD01039177.1.p1 GENE.GFUD01039177.1~~GFUD01039177.1.p1  ORF type:complete len:370 (+),score=61.26 GFUD01039177.1:73-1110(+)